MLSQLKWDNLTDTSMAVLTSLVVPYYIRFSCAPLPVARPCSGILPSKSTDSFNCLLFIKV